MRERFVTLTKAVEGARGGLGRREPDIPHPATLGPQDRLHLVFTPEKRNNRSQTLDSPAANTTKNHSTVYIN